METEKIQFWVDLIEKTLIAEQDKDTVNHLNKLREMLPLKAGDDQYLIHEICGCIGIQDRKLARRMFEMLKRRIL